MQLPWGIHGPKHYKAPLHSGVVTFFVATDEVAPLPFDFLVHPFISPFSSTGIILLFFMGSILFLQSGPLLQQFCVDTWLLAEQNNLNFIPHNEAQIHVNWYQGLLNHLQRRQEGQNDGNGNNAPGVPIILSSSYQGSPCNMTN